MFEAYVDTHGGDLREVNLRRYPVSADKPDKPFRLLADSSPDIFVAQSGLLGHEGHFPHHRTLFQAAETGYTLPAGQNELRVPLTWRAADGTLYTKTYVFRRDSYVIGVEFTVDNRAPREWRGYLYGQLQRTHTDQGYSMFALPTYTGGAIYSPENKFEKDFLRRHGQETTQARNRRRLGGGAAALFRRCVDACGRRTHRVLH